MNRREMMQGAGAALAGSWLTQTSTASDEPKPPSRRIAMLVYPRFTALDLVGPQQVLATLPGYTVDLVWKTKDAIDSDSGIRIVPTSSFKDCPDDLTVLFVPGGTTGTLAMMEDREVLAFLASRGAKAKYVTSVCTGSLVLGAAGLLRGYKATGHWMARETLAILGAEPVAQRVVRDRNRVTGAGVTAGIDFGLQLVALLKDEAWAKTVQLIMEYDPQPPFQAGSPAQAGAQLEQQVRLMFAPFLKSANAAAERVKNGWR